MRIIYYCQHVLGIGHFHRSLEICRACAAEHQVTMIIGGPAVDCSDAAISFLQLPGLQMDDRFSGLSPCDPTRDLEETKRLRTATLLDSTTAIRPNCLIIELYPFGRKAFRFELDPLLEQVRRRFPSCRVWCSVRDILVEKNEGREKHERRAIEVLNKNFDGILIHADQAIVSLEETFNQLDQLQVPLHYTGFVTPKPAEGARQRLRKTLGLSDDQRLAVVSIGSGSVGQELIDAVIAATDLLPDREQWFFQMFTGPYLDEMQFRELQNRVRANLQIERFSSSFVDWLAAADLSLSMAGYNTCMNILAAGVPALLLPFSQNREQRMRIRKLLPMGALHLLTPEDLTPTRLARLIVKTADRPRYLPAVRLDGAGQTRKIIEAQR